MAKNKICRGCYQPFIGRRGAKTCSARCRKRLQRTRQLLAKEIDRKPIASLARNPVRTSLVTIAFILGSLLLSVIAPTQGTALAQGYASGDSTLQKGMVVKLRSSSSDKQAVVERADYEDADKVFGVVVDLTDSLAAEVPAGSEVYVEQSGRLEAYVSDLNGEVKKGDLLTLSSLSGVLMRSDDRSVTTVGTALEDFPGENSQTVEVRDSNGDTQKAEVSLLDVNVDIKPPSPSVVSQNTNNMLARLSNGLVGREINGLRVLAALAIFATLLVIESEIIYGTITTSISAVGRNPLAKSLIGRESFKSVTVGLIVLIVGTVAISVLLWI
jgi:hypothetical protein